MIKESQIHTANSLVLQISWLENRGESSKWLLKQFLPNFLPIIKANCWGKELGERIELSQKMGRITLPIIQDIQIALKS